MDTIPQDTPQKQCTACLNFSPATPEFFFREKRSLYGVRSICKQCTKDGKHPIKPVVPDGYKQCAQCHRILPATLEFFGKNSGITDGIHCYCKECRHAEWHAKHPKEVIPEGYKQCRKCKQSLPFISFSCNNGRKDGLQPYCKVCNRLYIELNQEHIQEHRKQFRSMHVDLLRERDKQFRETPYGRMARNAHENRRRAIKKNIKGTYTPAQIQEQLKHQGYRCYYAACGFAKFEKVKGKYVYVIEHTFPISRVADSDIPANDISYLVLSCPSCNSSKGDKFPWEWYQGGRLL